MKLHHPTSLPSSKKCAKLYFFKEDEQENCEICWKYLGIGTALLREVRPLRCQTVFDCRIHTISSNSQRRSDSITVSILSAKQSHYSHPFKKEISKEKGRMLKPEEAI